MNGANTFTTSVGGSYVYYTDGGYAEAGIKTNPTGQTTPTIWQPKMGQYGNGIWAVIGGASGSSGVAVNYQTTANLLAGSNWLMNPLFAQVGNVVSGVTPYGMWYDSAIPGWICMVRTTASIFYYSTQSVPSFAGTGFTGETTGTITSTATTGAGYTATNATSFVAKAGLKHPTLGWIIMGSNVTTGTIVHTVNATWNSLHTGIFRNNNGTTTITGIDFAYNSNTGVFCAVGYSNGPQVSTATTANINTTTGFNNWGVPSSLTAGGITAANFFPRKIVYNPKLNKFVVFLDSLTTLSTTYLQWTSTSPDGFTWSTPILSGNRPLTTAIGLTYGAFVTNYGTMIAYGVDTSGNAALSIQS